MQRKNNMRFLNIVSASNKSHLAPSATAAFLGDSITQGVFELYPTEDGGFGPIFDYENVYHSQFKKKLNHLFPCARINIINAGSNGTDAKYGFERLERDVLKYSPDLVVVCFGANDCGRGEEGLETYATSLENIFDTVTSRGAEVIFLTPNTMAKYPVKETFSFPGIEITEKIVSLETKGYAEIYFEKAREICKKKNVPLCDCRKIWQKLEQNGVNTTALLSNHLNHPDRVMHGLFAGKLIELLFENAD